MNKGMLQAAICCLGLLLFANVSCATKKASAPAPEAAEQDAKVHTAEGKKVETPAVEAVAEGSAADTAEAEEAIGATRGGVPNVSVNVVQVNKKGHALVADETESAQDEAVPQAEPKKYTPPVTVAQRVPTNYNVYQYMPDTSKALGTESLLSEISTEISGKVFYELKEEGEKNFTAKVAVVNAVPLADFKRETEFGRIMGEYILTDLADRGLKVTELRMGKEINILPQTGEFIMSRNIGELASNAPELDYVVISTFTNTRKTLILQGRLVRLKDGLVKTSWRYGLPLNRELLGLFHTVEAPFKIAVKGMGQ